MRINININVKVNRLVKYFIISDLVFIAGWGFIEPVFSVFLVQKIPGATLITVGVSAAIYWILKSVVQLPLANFLDRTPGEKDDFYTLITGLVISSFSEFSFAFVHSIAGIYFVQTLHALGLALYFVSWQAIFSRHIDKERISFDWALDSTSVGISAGISALAGGAIANQFGFLAVFTLAGVLSLVSAAILVTVPDIVLPKTTTSKSVIQDHKIL